LLRFLKHFDFIGQVIFYLVDLLQDTNKEVRKTASKALDVVQDTNEEWATKLRLIKFETYNQEWLHVIESIEGGSPGVDPTFGGPMPEEMEYSDEDEDYASSFGRNHIMDFDEYRAEAGWDYDQQDYQYDMQYNPGVDEQVRFE